MMTKESDSSEGLKQKLKFPPKAEMGKVESRNRQFKKLKPARAKAETLKC